MATVLANTGKAIITAALNALTTTAPKYLAWGTGAGTSAATDTTLFTETTDETRVTGTPSVVTTTTTNDTYQVVATQTVATTGKTITNVGLFNASTVGSLFIKSDFTGVALAVGEAIQFTMQGVFS